MSVYEENNYPLPKSLQEKSSEEIADETMTSDVDSQQEEAGGNTPSPDSAAPPDNPEPFGFDKDEEAETMEENFVSGEEPRTNGYWPFTMGSEEIPNEEEEATESLQSIELALFETLDREYVKKRCEESFGKRLYCLFPPNISEEQLEKSSSTTKMLIEVFGKMTEKGPVMLTKEELCAGIRSTGLFPEKRDPWNTFVNYKTTLASLKITSKHSAPRIK